MTKRYEIIETIAGNGDTQWSVITVNSDTEQWIWKEDFHTKAEAESWLKHAC